MRLLSIILLLFIISCSKTEVVYVDDPNAHSAAELKSCTIDVLGEYNAVVHCFKFAFTNYQIGQCEEAADTFLANYPGISCTPLTHPEIQSFEKMIVPQT